MRTERVRSGFVLPRTASDLVPAVLWIGLAVATYVTIVDPNLRFGIVSPQLDALINEAAAIVAAGAAGLAWLRYRHIRDAAAMYETAAFILLAALAVVQLAASLGIGADALGLDIAKPGQAPLYAWGVIRLFAAVLLVRAGWLRLNPRGERRSPLIVFAPLAGALLISALIYVAAPLLPPALGSDAIAGLRVPGDVLGVLPGTSIVELLLQVVGFLGFSIASVYYIQGARRGLAPAGRYLGAGLVFAAFSQIHFALFPGAYSGIVSTSDLLRVAFYVFVVFGIAAETGATLYRLRTANRELADLRQVEVARASLAERARLAREVHDGLAQDLWVAKLATERLGKAQSLEEVRGIQAELDVVIGSSIAEARETVNALREAGKYDAPLAEVLERYGRRFATQTGLDVRVDAEQIEPGILSPSASGELLRIAQEAMSNVRKHADATTVVVSLARQAASVDLAVRDNGVGFDTAALASGYGLESMRERAQLAGGTLEVQSDASNGTTVTVHVPLT